jgi:hypothetical protein
MAVVAQSGECVVAVAAVARTELTALFISGASDLEEFLGELAEGTVVYFGAYPMRDNDGARAVSFVVPDSHGRTDLSH